MKVKESGERVLRLNQSVYESVYIIFMVKKKDFNFWGEEKS